MTTVYLFAYDAKGNKVDLSSRTYAEAVDGAEGHLEFDYNAIGSAGEILDVVNKVRSGDVWDFDAETCSRKRIAYFELRYFGNVQEAWITPWGQHCRIERTAHHVTNL